MKNLDIQDMIDDQIAKRGLDQYLDYAVYLPNDAPVPEDATHVVSVRSADGSRKAEVALKAKGFYKAVADAALAAF